MIGEEIDILFVHDTAFLTKTKCLTFRKLGLHNWIESFKKTAFWTVKIVNLELDNKRLVVEIIKYNQGEKEFSQEQLLLSDKLNKIESISFLNLKPALIQDNSQDIFPHQYTPQTQSFVHRPRSFSDSKNQSSSDDIIQTKNINFSFPMRKINFKNGHVAFEHKVVDMNETVFFSIPNKNSKDEFDAVKNYFIKVLGTRIQVNATIEIINFKINKVDANSLEIDKIDKTLIDNFKIDFVKKIVKKKTGDEFNKSLFTMEACLENLTDEKELASTLFKSEKDFLEVLLQAANKKHYNNLRFLSSKHAHELSKLLFVIKPFSFVFFLEGIKHNHVVWETLDTEEATYIWHIDKNSKSINLNKIEENIRIIKSEGKMAYISKKNEGFKRIEHDYSDIHAGFIKWKEKLESVLV